MAKKASGRRSKIKSPNLLGLYRVNNLYQSYVGFILGAIVVIVLGFLVASFLTKNANKIGQIGTGEKTTAQDQISVNANQYTVKDGDSLSSIAQQTYGQEAMWLVLATKNNIENPDLIYSGTKLDMPSKADAQTAFGNLTSTSYQVQSGDTLFDVAQRVYGDGSRWMSIARANNVGYLENGNPLIFSGNTLTIPR
jgi:nucleoid-associated protein YgaU